MSRRTAWIRFRAGEFWDILSDLHIAGVTIFISTAYMDEAERCSRVGLMYQGEIIRQGAPAELRALVRGDLIAIVANDLAATETVIANWMACPKSKRTAIVCTFR